MGAVDVVPFIPINGISMDECIELSNRYAELISRNHALPVYLYAKAARSHHGYAYQIFEKENMKGLKPKFMTVNGYQIMVQ